MLFVVFGSIVYFYISYQEWLIFQDYKCLLYMMIFLVVSGIELIMLENYVEIMLEYVKWLKLMLGVKEFVIFWCDGSEVFCDGVIIGVVNMCLGGEMFQLCICVELFQVMVSNDVYLLVVREIGCEIYFEIDDEYG